MVAYYPCRRCSYRRYRDRDDALLVTKRFFLVALPKVGQEVIVEKVSDVSLQFDMIGTFSGDSQKRSSESRDPHIQVRCLLKDRGQAQ